jgi:hypothetical protein
LSLRSIANGARLILNTKKPKNKNPQLGIFILISAGDGGIEPPPKVLETFVLPLN